jgi:hypothetical protein
MEAGFVEGFAGGLFDGIDHQKQIGIECALYLPASLAGAVAGLVLANRTDVAADGFDVRMNVVALNRLYGLSDLGEETEESAIGRSLQIALPVDSPFRAQPANPISDNGL